MRHRASLLIAATLLVLTGCSDSNDAGTDTTPADTSTDATASTDTADTVDTDATTADTTPGDTASEDTDDVSADTDTTTPTGVSYRFVDFLTQAAIVGATVTYDGATYTTNDEGVVYLDLPEEEWFSLSVTGSGFRDHYLSSFTFPGRPAQRVTMATDTTIAALEGVLGLTVDDSKVIVSLIARTFDANGDAANIADLTLGLNVASDLQLVFDADSTTGLSAGSTTLAGSQSGSIFVNATAGDLVPRFDHATYDCEGPWPIHAPAGSFVIATQLCHEGTRVTFVDFLSGAPIVGATVEQSSQTSQTTALGNAWIQVGADTYFDLKLTPSELLPAADPTAFRDHLISFYVNADRDPLGFTVATNNAIFAFEAILGLSADSAKSIVSVGVTDLAGAPIPDTTLSLDVASDLSVVFDATSQSRLSPGAKTLAGSQSRGIFINATAGDINPSFAHADGYRCEGRYPLSAPADSFVLAGYRCFTGPRFQLTDFLTHAPLAGATVAFDGNDYVSDNRGHVYLPIADDAWYTLTVTGVGFRDHVIYGYNPAGHPGLNYTIATDTTIAAIEAVLSMTVDSSKGLLSVAVRSLDEGSLEDVPGTTVTLDVASDISLVSDASSNTGIGVGNTTLAGSSSTVIFANAVAGDVTPTFAHTDGLTCQGEIPVNVPAGAFVISMYTCTIEK